MQIQPNSVVTLHYTLTNNEGDIIDASDDGSFLYLHGAMNIIPGLENALTGKSAGDEVSVKVSPEEGYGVKEAERIQEVPKEMFEGADQIQVGTQFHAQSPDGAAVVVTVVEVKEEQANKETVQKEEPKKEDGNSEIVRKLKELAELKDMGVISEEEFGTMKQRLIENFYN